MSQQPTLRNRITDMQMIAPRDIDLNPKNYRVHPETQRQALRDLFKRIGFAGALLVRKDATGRLILIDGELRKTENPDTPVPVLISDLSEAEADELLAAYDPLGDLAQTNAEKWATLADLIKSRNQSVAQAAGQASKSLAQALSDALRPSDKAVVSDPNASAEAKQHGARNILREKFIVPPFSILDARQGYWQDRKAAWMALGINGEIGRTDSEPDEDNGETRKVYEGETRESAKAIRTQEWVNKLGSNQLAANKSGTSVFDPVLCEIVYTWFGLPGGSVFDPFAGESVKGIVAEYLGLSYTGIELRADQIAANEDQALHVGVTPRWRQGDSATLDQWQLAADTEYYDLIFTSPPYYDLEVYSKSAKDGSAFKTYTEFLQWHRRVMGQAVKRLKHDRFAVIKVGEIRDERGIYHSFVPDTIRMMFDFGLAYYNEAILITPAGSLPIRVGKQFPISRKLGKSHQNILVFFKGDPKHIKDIYPNDIQVTDLSS